ncbi:MAG: PEP-CTERM sorting domain-containing protein [Planctomycetaceae bacterium]|jgi:hypothetical protein|nr:PEP-CTERM sorting domain-containing protein [Planctomycetaceae bacterium]
MKTLNFRLLCFSCAVVLGLVISVEVSYAEMISLGTGTPVTSKHHIDGANVTGNVTDTAKDGYADGRARSSGTTEDKTNTRDKNWFVIYTDVFSSEYKKHIDNNDDSGINARLSAVEYELYQLGSKQFGYVDTFQGYGTTGHAKKYMGSTNTQASGVVYGSTADLFAPDGIGVNAGGLSNFAVNGAGVLTTYGGGYFDEAGQYRYNADNTIDYLGYSDSRTFGFTGVQSGLVAFTTGFTMEDGFDYVNGTFAVMGELMGIYLNGTLLDSNLYYLSDDLIETGYSYAQRYNLEIDLTNTSIQALLGADGYNNLSFAVLGIPHKYTDAQASNDTYVDDLSFINLSADIMQNTESILIMQTVEVFSIMQNTEASSNGGETPEPATLLIFGIGLAGLGIRRKLMSKKSA